MSVEKDAWWGSRQTHRIKFIIFPMDANSLDLSTVFVFERNGRPRKSTIFVQHERPAFFAKPFPFILGVSSGRALLLTLTTFRDNVFSYSIVIISPRDLSYARLPNHRVKTADWLAIKRTTSDRTAYVKAANLGASGSSMD